MTIKDSNPLVSIIVRTKDRPKLLNKALLSIAAQTYRPIEVILVNDGGCDLATEELKAILGSAHLNYIRLEKNKGRAHAGNVGIENTKGKYVGFLDDDDEFYPEHVVMLVKFLEQSDYKVAYTDAFFVYRNYDADTYGINDERKVLAFSHDFAYGRLIFENYIPLMCLLFSREAIIGSGFFDTSLELYEDWDLLLRIGDKFPFQHIKKVTANYNQWSSELQISQGNKDQDFIRRSCLNVFSKHIDKITLPRVYEYIEENKIAKRNHVNELEEALKQQGVHVNELESALKHKGVQVNELESALKHKGVQVNELEETLKQQGVYINELESALKHKGVQVDELEETLKHKGVQVDELEETLKQKNIHINELEKLLKHKEDHADEMESALQEKEAYIQLIHSGHGWRLLTRYFKLRDRLLPAGTKRRLFVKSFIRIMLSPKRVLRKFTKANFKKFLYNLKRSDEDTSYSKADVSEGAEQNIPGKTANMDYFNFLFEMNTKRGEDYVSLSNPNIPETDIRLIAFYLPQFHPIPENDEWWGPGFTEWANVTRAVPQFIGHYQPRLPGELGFYDLRISAVQKRQVELAKQYGIYGFCFHFYWFNSRTLLEMPLKNFTENTDFPFCINWANENWTRRWDGQDSEVLIGQKHSPEDDLEFIKYVSNYFKNKNYIKIKSKPLLMVYRPALFPDPKATAERWRKWCLENGIGEIYLAATHSFEHVDPATIGFDAAVEFAPNTFVLKDISDKLQVINQDYKGIALDYKEAVRFSKKYIKTPFKKFRGICPGWDNEARKPGKGTVFVNSTPEKFKQWLKYLCHYTHSNFDSDERMIFINAWNEWAEGAYLEPDRRQGYANIRAVAEALTEYSREIKSLNENTKRQDTAVILHLFYTDLWHEISSYLLNLGYDTDIYISLPEHADREVCAEILKAFPDAKIFFLENRGRDIVPFLHIFSLIANAGYKYICKIHTKKSIHRSDGEIWRRDLYEKLCGSPDQVCLIKEAFDQHEGIGIIGPEGHQVSHSYYWGSNKSRTEELAKELGLKDNLEFSFFAGSMFWFRPSALKPLLSLNLCVDDFEPEMNQVDGTLAHAIERLFPLAARTAGYITVHTGFLNNPECIQDMTGNNGKTEKAEYPYRFCASAADKRPEV